MVDPSLATNIIQVNNNRQRLFSIGSNHKDKKLIYISITNV